ESVRHLEGGARISFGYTPSGARATDAYQPPPPPVSPGGVLAPPPPAPAGTRPSVTVSREYEYDAGGRPSAIVDSRRGRTVMRHDCYGQLVALARSDEPPEVYTHDVAGNRLAEGRLTSNAPREAVFGPGIGAVNPMRALTADQVEVTGQFVRERGNRIVRVERRGLSLMYTYDPAGYVIAKRVVLADGAVQEWRFTWNSHGRLVALTCPDGKVWRYEYDAAGRRLRKRGPDGQEIRYVWQGARVLYVLRDGVRQSTWVSEPGSGLPVMWADDRPHFILTDVVGTPTEVVNTQGSLEWQSAPRPWGDPAPEEGAPPPQLFGQWHDDESGLNYNVYRYYDPDLGRYISPDPIGIRGGLNEYVGVTSPFFGLDPLGLASDRNPGPFVLAPKGANPNTDPPAPGGTAYPAASPEGRSYRVGTPDSPRGRPISLNNATAAETHTSDGPFMVAFNGTNSGAGSSVDAAHHADQVMMQHLVDNAGEIPGQGSITVLIRGRDVCSECANAIDGPNGLGQQLADATGREVMVHEDDTPKKAPRVFSPGKPC
ncbi:MAG TPA: RHS repeat-associated core domain-containing protein, partial [Polyangia bacterium]|nr:RHS repeat-associated core domain-containing protein [Polyangia bacterium]